jgi:hypothetical protein
MLGMALFPVFMTGNILIHILRPFADAVKAGVASFMCSYNLLNNSQACQNSYLLNHILKEELGFQYATRPTDQLQKIYGDTDYVSQRLRHVRLAGNCRWCACCARWSGHDHGW